jgi:hypothetical protein
MKLPYEEYKRRYAPNDQRPGEWPRIEHEGRQTGRTFRMMAEAKRLQELGHKVYIIVPFLDYGRELRHVYKVHPSISFETFDTFDSFNPATGRLYLAHQNCRVLIDHAAIEQNFAYLLEQLHRFDGELPKGTS